MEIQKYKVKIELLEPMLGTCPRDKDVYKNFVAAKLEDMDLLTEELTTVPTADSVESRGWTTFHKDEDGYFLYDYALKGFLCESARTLKQWGTLKQLQDKFKRYAFVTPRRIRLPNISDQPLERPLRAMTSQGPRVTLVRSDMIAAGTEISFEISVLEAGGIKRGCIEEVLAYGEYLGLNQWRSGGYGRFKVVDLIEKSSTHDPKGSGLGIPNFEPASTM